MKTYIHIALVLLSFPLCAFGIAREWTATSGHKLTGDFIELKDGTVSLNLPDGKIAVVPLDKLSEADQQFVKEQQQKDNAEPKDSTESVATVNVSPTAEAVAEQGLIELEHPESVKQAIFSPDGKLVVTSMSGKGEIYIWERSTGKKLFTLQQNEDAESYCDVEVIAFSPDGKKMGTSGRSDSGKTLIIWDVVTGNKEQTLEDKENAESFRSGICFSPNGKLLCTNSNNKWAIWSVENGIKLKEYEDIQSIDRFSSDGKMLIGNNQIIDIATGKDVFKEWTHFVEQKSSGIIDSELIVDLRERYGYDDADVIAFSRDGMRVYESRIGYGSGNGVPNPLFDTTTGKLVATGEDVIKIVKQENNLLDSYPQFFGKNYEFFMQGSNIKPMTIGCYDIKTGNAVYDTFHEFALSERLWSSHIKTQFKSFRNEEYGDIFRPSIFHLAETTSGELLSMMEYQQKDATYSYEASFVKDGKTPGKTTVFIENGEEIRRYSVSPNGNYCWVGREEEFEIYDLRTGKGVGKVPARYSDSFGTAGCIFSPDNQSFMIYCNDNNDAKIQIWTVEHAAKVGQQQENQRQDREKMLEKMLQELL